MAQQLKAFNVVATADVNPEVVDSLGCTEWAGYDKAEVDAVIAEKDKEIAELKAQKAQAEDNCAYWKTLAQKNAADNSVMAKQRAEALKRERHQKYKRCLEMAEMCKARYDAEDAKENWCGLSWEYISKEMKYWERWRNRWLKIAEQFKDKEAK